MFFRKPQTNSVGLDPRIVAKEMEIEEQINDRIKNNRYSVFCFDSFRHALDVAKRENSYEKYELFYEMFSGYDNMCKLSYEDGNLINNLIKDPNYTAAIHRTFVGNMSYVDGTPSNSILSSIMSEGLINNGHLSSGGYSEDPSLTLTTSSLTGIGDLANLFFSYKHNNITVLLAFPSDSVDKHLQFKNQFAEDEIYTRKKGICYIKPEYIIGAIVKGQDQDKFYSREQIVSAMKKGTQQSY